jgi:hypothetical protein
LLIGSLLFGVGCSEQALTNTAPRRIELPAITFAASRSGLHAPMVRGETFRRGIVIGPIDAPENEEAFKRAHVALLDRAVAVGATDLQLVLRWLQVDYASTEIAPFESAHDDLLTWVIDQAKRRRLRVLLTTRLAVENEGERAARKLKPENWDNWWWSYRRLALHYARVAATRKVSMYSVGSELSSTESQVSNWRKLIKDVRKIYRGELTYFASADSFEKVGFWDALDVVGVSVDQEKPRSEAEQLSQLTALTKKLSRSAKVKDRGYVLAELGCGTSPADGSRQLICQRALYQSFRDESQLQGVYVRPAPAASDTETQAETARSAAEVVSHWYQKSKS